MRRLAFLIVFALSGCSYYVPEQPVELTVRVSWPSEAPSSMTVVAYGPALRELGRRTVTGADSVRFLCSPRACEVIAFPYTESEWRSLSLSRLSVLPLASVSYGSGYGPWTRFSAGCSLIRGRESRICAHEFLFNRDICLKVNDPALIASISGAVSEVPAGAFLRGGLLREKTSVPLRNWSFSGDEVRSSCCLFDRECVGSVSVKILLRDGRTVFRTSFPSGPPGMFPVPEISLPEVSAGGFFEAEVGDWTQSDTIIINV